LPEREPHQAELRVFGRAVRTLRERQGMSATELADAADVDSRLLRALESGTLDPSYELMLAVADGLRVTPSDLIIAVEQLARADDS
jgi:transcriptional regulator with XRE-family HTH domain